MEEQIFILRNKEMEELKESSFSSELEFQELLEKFPNLISGRQITPEVPRTWLFISREIGIPNEENGSNRYTLDHLFIDQDGILTLVEVKRSTDTRIRREVVGQVLDYAANSIYWSIEEIRVKYELACEKEGVSAGFKIDELTGESGSEIEFWEKVESNLRQGKIRLLFVADIIPKELKRIIEFLNEQMNPAEVLGVEIKQFGNDKIKTFVPKVIGQTTVASVKKQDKRIESQWTYESFIEELLNTSGNQKVNAVEKILKHLENNITRLWFGKGTTKGSIFPIIDKEKTHYQLFSLWTDGSIEIPFQYYMDKAPFQSIAKRKELLQKLNKIDGVNINENKITKRPSISMNIFKTEGGIKQFIEVFDWVIVEINRSN